MGLWALVRGREGGSEEGREGGREGRGVYCVECIGEVHVHVHVVTHMSVQEHSM